MAESIVDVANAEEVLAGTELLPDLKHDIVPYEQVDPTEKARIDRLMNEINLSDSNSIIFFGSKAQQELTSISDNMLEGVRNKDLGSAGKSLNSMVSVLRGFEVADFDPNDRPGFFARLFRKLFGGVSPVAYEGVRRQVDTVTDDLEKHKTLLLRDIKSLDKLYNANLDYFHNLESYRLIPCRCGDSSWLRPSLFFDLRKLPRASKRPVT